jgi:signal peptidase II
VHPRKDGPLNRKTVVFFSVFVLGVLLDQATKYWIRQNIGLHDDDTEITVIPGFFDIVHAENPGAAGGFLRDFQYRHVVFLGFTVVAFGVVLDLWRKLPSRDWFLSLTLGLILSGALGNAIDRVHKQTVTDFIRMYTEIPSVVGVISSIPGLNSLVHRGRFEWPSYNIADTALVVGVGLFLVHYLFLEEKEEAPKKLDAPPPDSSAKAGAEGGA